MREVPLLLPEGQTRVATLERSASETDVAPGEDGNRIRLSSLPVLLAGPILRYAADDEVVVWVATSVPVTVVGRVMDEQVDSHGRPSGSPAELRRGRTRPVQLATNLFVTHVSIPGPFPKRKILSYDLTFIAPPGHRFAGGSGLVPKEQLTYGHLTLPSFMLDETDRQHEDPVRRTVFMHGSCRKLHGPGIDMASKLDRAINDTHGSIQNRPRFLLLTGDQIYADDVGEDLQRPIMRASRLLLGFRDLLPNTLATLDGIPHRAALVREQAGFTSDAAERHLIGFGEFAAMYLFAWSPALWDCATIREIAASARSRNYHDAVWMRRGMANVPTYMMWDDHEITDDWPLDRAIVRTVEGSRYGEWIVANGMAAAFFFQLQGNRDRRGRGAYSQVAPALRAYVERSVQYEAVRASCSAMEEATGSITTELDDARVACEADLIGIRREFIRQARSIRGMHALAPTVPPVFLLDTRTQRDLSEDGPPGLLNSAAHGWIRRQFGSTPGPGYEPLLIVSPAPVVGNPAAEAGQQVATRIGMRYAQDCEAWSLNENNFRAFFATLQRYMRKLVFVSGDVHFAYTAVGRFEVGGGAAPSHFVQMTGSSMRNHPLATPSVFAEITAPGSGDNTVARTVSYRFVHTSALESPPNASLNSSLVVENNVSLAEVDWDGSAARVTHTIITTDGAHVHAARL